MPNMALRTSLLTVVTMVVAACGGGGSGDDPVATGPVATPTPATAPTVTDEPAGTDAPALTETTDQPEPTPEPTEVAQPSPEPLALTDISTLVDALQPGTDGTPLEIARQVIGFPYEIPVPDSATLYGVMVRVLAAEGATGDILDHEFGYAAVDPIADIDITLDDNGAGSVEVVDLFDPVMADIGFERAGSTASDPGGPGGPNSVNHVYVPTAPTVEVNGVVGVPGNVLVWATENLEGRGEGSEEQLLSGRRVDADIEVDSNDGFAVPLLAAIADAFPAPDAAVLADGQIRTITRPDDSFDIDKGKVYLDLTIGWNVEASFEDVVALFDGPNRLDAGAVLGAETSFFEPTRWEVTEGSLFDDGDWRRSVLLAERYDAMLRVDAPDEPGGPVEITLDVGLDPVAPVLLPPE
jgi:hypothetical protein